MSVRFPLRRALLLAASLFVAATSVPNASADTVRRHRTYPVRAVHYARTVYAPPLQPFSMEVPSARAAADVRVAYYAPRAIPRAQPIEQDEETAPMPEMESRGSGPTVSGNRAVLRNGVAYAPANAPTSVKSAIWAVNTIRSKPYHWGGGHGSFQDSGYDCSGTVSFALHYAGVLNQPLPSSDLLRYGERGRGRWITIYSRRGHTFATIAGLRLDTTDFSRGGNVGPRWYNDGRDTWGFEARHPEGL
jgi:cell wall-associated NlpC family hydrolase